MNKNNLKSFAPQARKDFIAAVTVRAQQLGFTATGIEDATLNGDVLIINGVGWPARVSGQREKLKEKISQHGFAQTMEEVAYTWFNRFAALRYMELHDFLDHGHRVLSSRDDGLPELLRHASEITLPGLNAANVTEMQLAGNRDNELYKLLLVAQCNALSRAMPFLFERIDDDTELLLPDNLLRTDSIIAKLVAGVPEDDWQEIEVIGWLYQFYISEKKDQVIGKVVKSEDIPAATQLFTPNWIVQYLVQNSVGRLWLMANPQSKLAQEWPYYITPAEQTPEVQAQLDALIQTRVREDGDTLNPETITVLDPACGSGHILVVAYDVLKAIYLERGYRVRDIPRLILEKNLFGLDIDDRAAQMAGFALLMKARADDRRLFTATDDAGNLQTPKLNVLSLQESKGLSVDELATHLAPFNVQRATITALVETFEHAKTFGSLIQIPYALKTHLAVLPQVLALVKQSGDMYATAAADDLLPLVEQAQVLAMQFDAVVANPPYMGGKGMNLSLKDFARTAFPNSKSDVFSMFIERCSAFGKPTAGLGFVTPFVWMFISSYKSIRMKLIDDATIQSLIQLEYNAFEPACVPVCTFLIGKFHIRNYVGSYIKLSNFKGHERQSPKTLEAINNHECGWFFDAKQIDFNKIPGSPIAYWVSNSVRDLFLKSKSMGEMVDAAVGLQTGDNEQFLRRWNEINITRIGFDFKDRRQALSSGLKWFPLLKGGDFRKWYGNHEWVVNWENDGEEIRNFKDENGKLRSRPQGTDYYFKECVSWSDITSASNAFRYEGYGFISNVIAPAIFIKNIDHRLFLLAGNNIFYNFVTKVLNPTIHFNVGDFASLPFPEKILDLNLSIADDLISISKDDWDASEVSWDFKKLPWIDGEFSSHLSLNWKNWDRSQDASVTRIQTLEEENNRLFIDAYGLQDELSPEVPESQITLARADREKDCQRLISYAIGCMMGRYSLDDSGLIYAHAGNVGFEPGRYATFPADADGIVPITDELWFADEACSRIREFLNAVWGAGTLEENMAWLAESLGTKASETPDETIRRYIADKFFKDHLQTYKKRPIYWLFSSGRQGAFQALVYLHRYNESTLARMRAEYVIPLTAKMASRLEMLEQDANAAASAAARTKIRKQIETLRKKQTELLAFDEILRHFADMRITLDLDDGVKVNYGKFGDLLEGVKLVTGGASDE